MDDSPDHINGSVPDCATCGLPCPSTNFQICLMCGKQVHSNCCQELGLPALIFGCGTCAVRFTSDARWNWRNTADPKLRSVLNNHGDQRSQTIGIKLHLKDAISRITSRNVGNEENITPQVTVNVVNSQSVQGVGNATCHIPAALSCTSNSQNPDPVCEGTDHKRLSSSNMCSKYRSKKRKSTETYDPGIPIRGHYETDPDTSTCNGYTKVAPKAFELELSKEFHDRVMGPAIQDQINYMKNSVNNLKNEWGTGGQCDAGYAVFREISDKILSHLLDTLNGRIRIVLGGDGNVTKDELMWTMMMYLLSCVMTSPQLDLDTSWDLVSYYLQSKQIRIPVSYNRARMKLIIQNLTVVDIDKSSTNHASTGAECFREMEQLLTKAARNIVGNAVAVTGDDQQDYYKGAPGSNPKQSVYCRDVFVDAYFFILYATKLQSKNYDRLNAIETLIADLGITPDSKPETWFSFDQGYATPNQLDVLQKYHLNSLSIVSRAEFGNHAFWTNSANRKDEMRLRGKNYLNGSEQDFTPRVSSEFTIDDDPRMGHTQFVALHESRTAIAVREPGIGLSSTNAKVLRFIGTGDTKKLVEDLFGVYVAVPKSFNAKVKNSLPFFPGISSQAKNKWCKLAEVFLTTKTNPLTVLKLTQDWFIRRRFRITADVGGAIVRTTKMRH